MNGTERTKSGFILRSLERARASRDARQTGFRLAVLATTCAILLCLPLALTSGCLPAALLPGSAPPDSPASGAESAQQDTPMPTFTPPVPWPATWTPTWTPTTTPTSTPRPTFTPVVTPYTPAPGSAPRTSQGPLKLEFWRNNIWCPDDFNYIAEFTLRASGGNGLYTYFRDNGQIGGPTTGEVTYQVVWQDCGGAPGTFTVRSGDGQQVSEMFWIDPPDCCE
jgi:hypothetical protein